MSVAILVLGEPGSGKSASMRNFDPANTLLIQTIKKPLPFKASGWSRLGADNKTGNIVVSDDSAQIASIMQRTRRKVIVLDDWNLLTTNQFMRRSHETGFQKFADIGRSAWDVLMQASALPDDVRVYLLGHTSTDDLGTVRAKTIGKLIDEKCPVESLFSIVLRATVIDGQYLFSVKNNGFDTVKTPIGLFDTDKIDNDLASIDAAVCDYYQITQPA